VNERRASDPPPARERLPLDDPGVDALDAKTREYLSWQWEMRATAELRMASIFAVVARELFETGAHPAVLSVAARAVGDEVRHAEVCRLLAERYGGRQVAWPTPGRTPMPLHRTAPRRLRPTLHVTAMGCINETIANAWLERSFHDATSPLARAAVRELMADDVYHARLGWAHLASPQVTAKVRAEIAGWLPRVLDAAALPWLRDAKRFGEGVPEHGVPSGATTREVVRSTVHAVILPGFEALGVETRLARDWSAQHLDE
jgi:hypothetical protein